MENISHFPCHGEPSLFVRAGENAILRSGKKYVTPTPSRQHRTEVTRLPGPAKSQSWVTWLAWCLTWNLTSALQLRQFGNSSPRRITTS
jgi:hypothetical protein